MRILLIRTDSIGDVVLTMPMAGLIKKYIKNSQLHFLGKTYTKAIVNSCSHIDEFINWDDLQLLRDENKVEEIRKKNYDVCIHVFPRKNIAELMKKSGIKMRIGTSGRIYNYLYCNKIVRFSRRRSNLHEAQLNLKLLKPLGISGEMPLEQLVSFYGFNKIPEANSKVRSFLKSDKINIILHPKSKGSAVEWGLTNFSELIENLPVNYHVYITGTEEDEKSVDKSLPLNKVNVTNLLGKLSLEEFISFISLSDGIVAASTGPLHISAAFGKVAIGLFSSRKPIHPGRWKPLGESAHFLVFDENCESCRKGEKCQCIQYIKPAKVIQVLESVFKGRS